MNTAMHPRPRSKTHHARTPTLLLVDDDRPLVEATRDWLQHQGYRILTARNLQETRQRLSQTSIDLLLSDLRLDEGCGLEILRAAREMQPGCCRLAMTGYASAELQVRALEAGASQVLQKPLDDHFLIAAIEAMLREQQLADRDRRITEALDQRIESVIQKPVGWFGSGAKMQEIFGLLERVADSTASILITGEPGTGKSKLARYIHQRSARQAGPFVELACGAIPEALLESELFGHAAGAFTGAMHAKIGKFQYAQGGSLFLDEIATASMAMQVRLLRVLQEKAFEAVGSNQTMVADARMIFATNENLEQAVASGRFRQDLYYRIHVVAIELPPLRERLEDLRELADGFLMRSCQEFGRHVEGFSQGAYQAMLDYSWPGNVRELENAIQRAVLVCLNRQIQSDDLAKLVRKPTAINRIHKELQSGSDSSSAQGWSENFKDLDEALSGPERAILLGALDAHGWNRHATAQRLGINRTTLYKKMKRLGIDNRS